MKIRTLVKGSLTQLRMNIFRTGLTLLGIIFGVASVIAMVTIGEGAQKKILDNINAMGATQVQILPAKVSNAMISQIINDSKGLSIADVRVLKNVLPMENRDIAYLDKIKIKTTNWDIQISDFDAYAVSQNFVDVSDMVMVYGRNFTSRDFSANSLVGLISLEYARQIFGNPQKAVGEFFSINYKWLKIVGVFEKPFAANRGNGKRGLPVNPSEFSKSVLLPITTSREKISPLDTYAELRRILIKCQSLQETTQVKNIAEKVLQITHNARVDYKIVSPLELLEQKQSTQRILNIVLLSIASISLLVGGIGIMNIMLANVLERRSEIGLRRALGAKRRHIIIQFLFESVLVCFIGGGIGICTGLGISFAISHFTEISVYFSFQPILISFGISFFTGVLFGIMPAWKAAQLNPVEALHHE
ncbi:MAG: ABC-type transport system, involved in lipoprotein release, permease component [uncultured bacterium]|nr:MAG: ABC-type transport system, involved in lipoprotein release, permease component [uncultured bacterium]